MIDRPGSPHVFVGPVTVPPEVTLIFQDGVIDLNYAIDNLTIQGPLIAPGKQIFKNPLPTGPTEGYVMLRDEDAATEVNRYLHYINPLWFGGEESSLAQAITKAIYAGGLGARVLSPYAPSSLLNIEHYGCIPWSEDPDFDNAIPINAMIDRLGVDLFGTIFVPGRAYGLKTAIQVPVDKTGFRMQGVGINYDLGEPGTYLGAASRFIWAGTDGGTMMEISCQCARLDGITFRGIAQAGQYTGEDWTNYHLSNVDHAGICLHFKDPGSGERCGRFHCGDIACIGGDVGVQIGPDSQCDMGKIEHLLVDRCVKGVANVGSQQVGISIGKLNASYCTYALYITGGRITVDSCDVLSSVATLAYAKHTSEATIHTLSNIHVDDGAHNTVLLDASEMALDGRLVVNFDNLFHPGSTPTTPTIKLASHVMVNINNGHRLPAELVSCQGTTGRRCRVKVANTRMYGAIADLVTESASAAPWTLDWRDCVDNSGETIADGSVSGA